MTPVVADRPAAPAWDRAWTEALAELELGVEEAEALLRAGHAHAPVAVWHPPTQLGVLPASLRERATMLLERQIRVARQLAESAAHSRRQLRAVEGLRAEAEARPVYLDTAG